MKNSNVVLFAKTLNVVSWLKDTTLFLYENPQNVIKSFTKHPPKWNFISNLKILSDLLYLRLFSNERLFRSCHLLCKRPRCHDSANKTHVAEKIFKLSSIHASVIYQIRWIHWISDPFRKNSNIKIDLSKKSRRKQEILRNFIITHI